MFTILAILIAILVLTLPVWPYSRHWSGVPSGMVALVMLVFVMLMTAA